MLCAAAAMSLTAFAEQWPQLEGSEGCLPSNKEGGSDAEPRHCCSLISPSQQPWWMSRELQLGASSCVPLCFCARCSQLSVRGSPGTLLQWTTEQFSI